MTAGPFKHGRNEPYGHPQGFHLISERGGLANRLRGWSALAAICRVLGLPLTVSWIPDWACPGDCSEMFDFHTQNSASAQHHEASHPAIISGKTNPQCNSSLSTFAAWAQSTWGVSQREIRSMYIQQLRRITPTPRLESEITRFLELHDPSGCLGVHYRGTDHVAYRQKNGLGAMSYSSLISQARHLSAELRLPNLFLATDDAECQIAFHAAFGSRVHSLPNRFQQPSRVVDQSRSRTTSLLTAATDLYLLSKSSHILGTPGSSFSSIAATIGGTGISYFSQTRDSRRTGV